MQTKRRHQDRIETREDVEAYLFSHRNSKKIFVNGEVIGDFEGERGGQFKRWIEKNQNFGDQSQKR
jgi:hypothetical protein